MSWSYTAFGVFGLKIRLDNDSRYDKAGLKGFVSVFGTETAYIVADLLVPRLNDNESLMLLYVFAGTGLVHIVTSATQQQTDPPYRSSKHSWKLVTQIEYCSIPFRRFPARSIEFGEERRRTFLATC